MKRIAIVLVAIMFLITILPLVNGDEANPEIKDSDYDANNSAGADRPVVQQANINCGWFSDELPNSFKVTLQVKRIYLVPADVGIGSQLRNVKQYTAKYYVFFKSTANGVNYFILSQVEVHIDLPNITNPQNSMPTWHSYIGVGSTIDDAQNVDKTELSAGTVDRDKNTISVLVQKSDIGNPRSGDKLTNTYAETVLEPTSMQIINLNLLDVQRDRAPDDGYGSDYEFKESNTQGTIELTAIGTTSKSVSPGNSATYKFSLRNNGDDEKVVSMKKDGTPDSWTSSFDKDSITLGKGSSTYVNLTVKTPSEAKDGDYARITVYGTYSENSKQYDTPNKITVNTSVKIQQSYGVSLSTSQSTKKCGPNHYITFPLTVKNEGTKEDTISIAVEDKQGDLTVEIMDDKTEVKLKGGKTDIVNIKVIVPDGHSKGNFDITMKATSTNDSTKFATKTLTVDVSEGGTPLDEGSEGGSFDMNKIFTLLLLGLVVAVVIVAYAVWRKGQIRRVQVVPKTEEFKQVKKVDKKEEKKEVKKEEKKK